MKEQENKRTIRMILLVSLIIATLVIIGTLWMGQSAKKANEDTVSAISRFYLDELAGRREQVIISNLNSHIRDIKMAVSLLTENDLKDLKHLRAYQAKMRDLYGLDKFAFVGDDGLIYTSQGVRRNLKDYDFDPEKLSDPKISVRSIGTVRKAVIAVSVDDIKCEDVKFRVCFMEIDMDVLLSGLSLQSDSNDTTFCNIYTRKGEAFTNMVLGGLAKEDNLLKALKRAKYDSGSSMEQVENDFAEGKSNIVSFTYDGIRETLDYVPIEGTDWMLTYLVRESVISEQVSDISERLTSQSLMQTILTALVMMGLFVLMMQQARRNAKMMLEQETFEAESRIKQEEMEQRLELQEELLAQEKKRVQQDKMITAMASDYRSVYYVDLDRNEGKCYRSIAPESDICPDGKGFDFEKEFREYADKYVDEKYKEGFLKYIDIDNIREQLSSNSIIVHRYLTVRDGKERYEMLRMAGVRHPQDRDDDIVHAIGVGFTDVDEEIREEMAQSQALSDALAAAEDASKAKTAFLSNMSHEIRTPMNAIIGLDNIALSDPDLPEKTRGYLEKIDGSAHHLLGLINDILDVSRIEAGRLMLKSEEFSFSTLLEQVNTIIGGQCNDKGLDYECHVTNSVDDYYIGDDMKLKQVLINILGNSVKFTPEGGKVELSVAKTASFEGKTTLTFTMSDTGIGMDESFIPKMFEPFSQEDSVSVNRYGSTGLGMAITKSIVEMMNGNISVSSKKGEGTTFTVAVTLMDSDKKSEGREDTEIRLQDLSVLIVDDDEIACEHSRLILEGVGISADTVMSGKEAVEMVKIHEARRDPYNMILLDLKMPEMDGVETAKQIRAVVGRDSVIIIITAYNWEDVLDEAVSAGVDSFLAKPLFAANVLEEFKATLNKRKERTEEHKADLKGRKILLAEDMAVNAEIVKELLKMKGIEVDHAENGRVCVDMFQMEPEGYYDAILMDMRMPEMDGLEATRMIRALSRKDAKEIPIIALTANAFDEDVQKSLQAGLNAHLSKPVEPSSLFATLEKLIKD